MRQEIYVDLVALSRVHRELRDIHNDLNDFDMDYARAHSESMGHRDVIRAFNDFVYGWTDGRERINEQCEVICQQIAGAVEAYNQVEDNIGSSADQMKGQLQ